MSSLLSVSRGGGKGGNKPPRKRGAESTENRGEVWWIGLRRAKIK